MIALLGFAVGLLSGALMVVGLRGLLSGPVFARTNLRGLTVPTGAGLAIVVPGVVAIIGGSRHGFGAAAVAAAGFGGLGLLDDLAGDRAGKGGTRGIRGHLAALAGGRVTTGLVKLVLGPVVAVLAIAALPDTRLIVPAAVVALSANMGNLLDRAPGRCTKVGLAVGVAAVGVAVAASDHRPVAGAALLLGAAAATLPGDLGERLMLGDTGANVVGAAAGLGLVGASGPRGEVAIAVVLVALTAASEKWSFSSMIDRVGPLRAADQLGRAPR